ncbi:phosphatase PAP2 family protein [Candidatus Roizmanbacteria bacterium]|nr:phosphatase PAP2 family protein [Candidatus Roizmanbacteria bacterium]
MNILNALDIRLTKFIHSLFPHNQFFDYFFSFFSLRGNSIFIWAVIIFLVLLLEERKNPGIQKRDVAFMAIFLLCFSVSFIISDLILKNLIKRPRPTYSNSLNITEAVEFRLAQCPKNYSFPSSHATTAFAAATVITAFDKKRRWFYYGVAILISLSRIYLGCHYFFDVAFGAVTGLTISKIILLLHSIKLYSVSAKH